MKLVGLDTGVFVAGVFWRHEPHACVEAWFRGFSGCPDCLVLNAANCVESATNTPHLTGTLSVGLFDQRQRRSIQRQPGAAPQDSWNPKATSALKARFTSVRD